MTPAAQPVNRFPLYLSPGISDQWVLTGCRFLGTSTEKHFRSSFLFLPNPFDRTFSPSVQYLPVTWEAPWGGLQVSPVQHLRGAYPHLTYSIDNFSVWSSCHSEHTLKPNGPVIWGGCVTRRSIRAESWYFSQKTVTVQGGYGTCFCSPGTAISSNLSRKQERFCKNRDNSVSRSLGEG